MSIASDYQNKMTMFKQIANDPPRFHYENTTNKGIAQVSSDGSLYFGGCQNMSVEFILDFAHWLLDTWGDK